MIVRFYSVAAFGRTGAAAVSPEARYCAILWRGEHRIERRHLAGPHWTRLTTEVAAASSSVAIGSEVHQALTPSDPHAEILAVSLTNVTAAPLRIAAAIDGELRDYLRSLS